MGKTLLTWSQCMLKRKALKSCNLSALEMVLNIHKIKEICNPKTISDCKKGKNIINILSLKTFNLAPQISHQSHGISHSLSLVSPCRKIVVSKTQDLKRYLSPIYKKAIKKEIHCQYSWNYEIISLAFSQN